MWNNTRGLRPADELNVEWKTSSQPQGFFVFVHTGCIWMGEFNWVCFCKCYPMVCFADAILIGGVHLDTTLRQHVLFYTKLFVISTLLSSEDIRCLHYTWPLSSFWRGVMLQDESFSIVQQSSIGLLSNVFCWYTLSTSFAVVTSTIEAKRRQ